MKVAFKTEHDSIYEIDFETKTWTQLEAGHDREGYLDLRTESGPFFSVSEIRVGHRVDILAPPFVPGSTFRHISTSPVASIIQDLQEPTATTN